MPLLKAAQRGASATPIRETSPAKSNRQSEYGTSRRSARNGALADLSNRVNNPLLPEIQVKQSFAYGSSKAPILPAALKAHGKMSLQQMAKTIDEGLVTANKRLEEQKRAAEALVKQAKTDAREDRAKRRSESRRSSEDRSVRETSVTSESSETVKQQRTESWAKSLTDSSPLPNIDEEEYDEEAEDPEAEAEYDQPETELEDDPQEEDKLEDDDPDLPGDASSFPPGDFDTTYHFERDKSARPSVIRPRQSPFVKVKNSIASGFRSAGNTSRTLFQASRNQIRRIQIDRPVSRMQPEQRDQLVVMGIALRKTLNALFSLIRSLAVAWLCSLFLCQLYTRVLHNPESKNRISRFISRTCTLCTPVTPFTLPSEDGAATDLAPMWSRMREVEKDVSQKHSAISETLNRILSRTSANEAAIDSFDKRPFGSDIESSIMPINYASAKMGAIVDPYNTNPTYAEPAPLYQRVIYFKSNQIQHFLAPPPVRVLETWTGEPGDCWCAAGSSKTPGLAQLGILMNYTIYPEELVIQGITGESNPNIKSSPKRFEVWAEFDERTSAQDYAQMDMGIGTHPVDERRHLKVNWRRIGKGEYDARPSVPGLQKFRLDVNQGKKYLVAAQRIVLRIVDSWGAKDPCLYRIRLHGEPVIPHDRIDE